MIEVSDSIHQMVLFEGDWIKLKQTACTGLHYRHLLVPKISLRRLTIGNWPTDLVLSVRLPRQLQLAIRTSHNILPHPQRNGSGHLPRGLPPESYHHSLEQDAMFHVASRPSSRSGSRRNSGGVPLQMDEEHLSRRLPARHMPSRMPPIPDHRRISLSTSAGRTMAQSPPLSPKQNIRPDYPPHPEHIPRYHTTEEWERGRPAQGYRDHHAPASFAQYPIADGRSLPSLAAAISARSQLSQPLSQSQSRPPLQEQEAVSPQSATSMHSAGPEGGKGGRKSFKGDKGTTATGGDKKKPAARRGRTNTPTPFSSKARLADARLPVSAALYPITTASTHTMSKAADENDKAGIDSLLALSGHSSDANASTPRKRSAEGDADAPDSKKLKTDRVTSLDAAAASETARTSASPAQLPVDTSLPQNF